MRSNEVNDYSVVYMGEKLRLVSLCKHYNARVDVYIDILNLLERLDRFAKQKLTIERNKLFIEGDKIKDLNEFIWLVNSSENELNLLKEFDYKHQNSASASKGLYEDLLEYLNTYRCRLELLGAKLIVLGYREQVKGVWKSIEKIEELGRFMSKLLYQ